MKRKKIIKEKNDWSAESLGFGLAFLVVLFFSLGLYFLIFLKNYDKKLIDLFNRANVIVLGCGLGKSEWSKALWQLTLDYLSKNDWMTSCSFGESMAIHASHSTHNDFDFFAQDSKDVKNTTSIMVPSYRVLPYYVESPNHGDFELIVNHQINGKNSFIR